MPPSDDIFKRFGLTPVMPLFASLGDAHPSWWGRWLRWAQPPEPAGMLLLTRRSLSLKPPQRPVRVEVPWAEPFLLQVSCWPYGSGTAEVNLSLRARHSAPLDPWLQVRTLWPTDALRLGGLSRKQEIAPFLHPLQAQALWRALAWYADLHGARVPHALNLEVAPERLKALRSESKVFTCTSCGRADVTPVASQAWTCNSCGYQGGDGWAHMAPSPTASPSSPRPSGLRDAARLLEEARAILLGVVEGMSAPVEEAPPPEVFVYTGEPEPQDPERAAAIARATERVRAAHRIATGVAERDPASGAQLLVSALGSGLFDTDPHELLATTGRALRLASEWTGG